MPSSVKNGRDERLWDEAKKIVRDSYADVEEGSDRFWKLVQGIYQRMKGNAPTMAKADVKAPGSRGGAFYIDDQGHVRYGDRPTGHHHVREPSDSSISSPRIVATEKVKGGNEYEYSIQPVDVGGKKLFRLHGRRKGSSGPWEEWPVPGRGNNPTYADALKAYGQHWWREEGNDVEIHDPAMREHAQESRRKREAATAAEAERAQKGREQIEADRQAAEQRKASLDDAVRKVKWTTAGIQIPADDEGGKDLVEGPSHAGLMIQRLGETKAGSDAAFAVTHIASGMLTGLRYDVKGWGVAGAKQAAKVAALRLAGIVDWTKPAENIRAQSKRLGPIVAALRRDPYADLSELTKAASFVIGTDGRIKRAA